MEKAILFLVFWLGCTALHTLYDLKIKPLLEGLENETSDTNFL